MWSYDDWEHPGIYKEPVPEPDWLYDSDTRDGARATIERISLNIESDNRPPTTEELQTLALCQQILEAVKPAQEKK